VKPLFQQITVLGAGLIGGSILLDSRKTGVAKKLVAWCRSKETLQRVKTAAIADTVTTDILAAVRGSDFVVFSTPIEVMGDLAKKIVTEIDPRCLITDVGSVKASVEAVMAPIFSKKGRWLGSHPMAGSEQSGLSAARADLFQNATVILTPDNQTPPETVTKLSRFWEILGGKVLTTTPEKHDYAVAQISHLPHLVAALLVDCVQAENLCFHGPGFRDATRIAAGPPALWCGILKENREAILASLDLFLQQAATAREALNSSDWSRLEEFLDRASRIRHSISGNLT